MSRQHRLVVQHHKPLRLLNAARTQKLIKLCQRKINSGITDPLALGIEHGRHHGLQRSTVSGIDPGICAKYLQFAILDLADKRGQHRSRQFPHGTPAGFLRRPGDRRLEIPTRNAEGVGLILRHPVGIGHPARPFLTQNILVVLVEMLQERLQSRQLRIRLGRHQAKEIAGYQLGGILGIVRVAVDVFIVITVLLQIAATGN